jgi:ABC-type transport system substrate-binding protein
MDWLLDEASKTIEENKREAIFKKVQDLLNEDIPWLPIYVVPDYSAVKKELKGVGYRHPITPITVQPDARWER